MTGDTPSPPSYDLLERPWVPTRKGATTEDVGLRELFVNASRIDDLAVPVPPAAAGLWRVLYALTARITGLDDPSLGRDVAAWRARQREVLDTGVFDPGAVMEYFDRHQQRFDLFGPMPWMQDPRLADECPKAAGVNKLVMSRPAGQNQVWFGHFTDLDPEPAPAAEAAWFLLVQLYFGPSGRCSARTVSGVSEANTTAGPLRSALSYHPVGRNLFESLVIGVPAPATATTVNFGVRDVCPWERDEPLNALGVPPPPTWPGAMLTARARHAVLLVPGAAGDTVTDAYITWAYRQPSPECVDPYVIRNRSREGSWYSRPADEDRALWRDLDALLLQNTATREVRRPAALDGFDDLPDDVAKAVRIRAYGFAQDGQTRDRQWFSEVTPPILAWLEERDPDSWRRIACARQDAEDVAHQLGSVCREAWRRAVSPPDMESSRRREKAPPGPWARRATAWYWPQAERAFWRLVRDQSDSQGVRPFVALARQAIDHAVGEQERDPKVARAVSWARGAVGAKNNAQREHL